MIATIVWRSKARRHIVGGLTAVWALAMLALKPNLLHEGNFLDTFAYFTLFFGTGVAAYLLRDVIRLCWLPLAALGAAFFATIGSDTAEIMSALFLGYGLLWLSTFKFGGLRAYIGQNDYSYGTYIYGYPASQAILALSPDVNILSLIAATLAVTLVLAFMSWELIERPALSMVRSLRSRQQLVPRKRLTPTAVPVSNNAMARLAVGQQAETQPSPPSATSLSDALARRPSRPPTLVPTEPEKAFDDSRLRARLAKISRGQHGLELQ